ncbi:hypothetical protein FBU30_009136 [Linnemannia zychae]|nr:hypothetical protein FBU30_009136 [Linnemannia zychae]
MPRISFSSLPTEVVVQIALHLSRSDLVSCVLVCHAWLVLFEPLLYRTFTLTTGHCLGEDSSLTALLRNLHHIRHMTTTDVEFLRFVAFRHLPLSDLQTLDVALSEEELSSFLFNTMRRSNASLMADSRLTFGPAQVLKKFLVGCSRLRRLSFGGTYCFTLTDDIDPFKVITVSCPPSTLEFLKITFEPEEGPCLEQGPLTRPEQSIRHEEYLQAVYYHQQSPSFTALKELNIWSPSIHFDPTKLALLARCPNLERIVLESPDSCTIEYLAQAVKEFCPKLIDLVWDGVNDYADDLTSAMLKSTKLGWRVLTLPYMEDFGPLSYEVLMGSVETLEELVLDKWGNDAEVRHDYFLDLLCSAKNLRLLDGHRDGDRLIHQTAVEVHAFNAFKQHADRGRDRTWALGPRMEYLQMQIVGVPRPDVVCRDNGRPLDSWRFEGSLDDSRRYDVQKWIYEQLGRMTSLKTLVLGMIGICYYDLEKYDLEDGTKYKSKPADLEDALERLGERCKLISYQCLEFSLESGLEKLSGLKELRVLNVQDTAHRIGVKELEWMHVHWPKLKEIKGLVSERRWAGEGEDGAGVKREVEAWMAAHPRGIGSFYVDL